MHETVLNTPKETAYRLLLALSIWPENDYSARWISAVDFIAEYGAVFGISNTNLHGDNGMKFTEYIVRIDTVEQALRYMVLHGWAIVALNGLGYTYHISSDGMKIAQLFHTSYANLYRQVTASAYSKFGHLNERELDATINRRSVESAEKENADD